MGFDMEDMAWEYVLIFGTQLEALEPPPLREKVLDAAKSVVAFYTQGASKAVAG